MSAEGLEPKGRQQFRVSSGLSWNCVLNSNNIFKRQTWHKKQHQTSEKSLLYVALRNAETKKVSTFGVKKSYIDTDDMDNILVIDYSSIRWLIVGSPLAEMKMDRQVSVCVGGQ